MIRVKSGAKFPKSADDWVFWDDVVPKKLKEYNDLGYKLVIFTNQNGISKGHTLEANITKKVEALSISVKNTKYINKNISKIGKNIIHII